MKRATSFAMGLLLLVATAAWAQSALLPGAKSEPAEAETAKPTPSEKPEEKAVEVPEVMGRAAENEREVRQLEAAAAPNSGIVTVVEALPEARERLKQHAAGARERIQTVSHVRALRDLEATWLNERQQLDLWNAALTDRLRGLDKAIKRFDEIEALWQKTRAEFSGEGAPPAVLERIAAALSSLEAPRRTVTARRDELLEIQAEIATELDQIADILALVDETEQKLRSGILGTDAPPIWVAVAQAPVSDIVVEREQQALRRNLEAVRAYVANRLDRVLIHLLTLLAAIVALRYLNGAAANWPEHDESVRASAAVLARPYAGALLVGYSISRWIYPAAPYLFYNVLGLIGLIPLVRLLPPLIHRSNHKFVYALVVLYVVNIARELIAPLITLERLVFMAEMSAVAVVLALVLRPVRVERLPSRVRILPLTGTAIRLAIVILVVSVIANALGSTAFGAALGEGALRSVYVALVLYGVYRVIDGVVVVALRSSLAARLNMVRAHRAPITRRILLVARATFVAIWGYMTADGLGVWDWLVASTASVLAAEFSVGDLTISPGSAVTFLLVFLVALYFSRLLRFTLEQDVLPRLRLPRGVPYAITATLHYGILFVALMAALAAAGIDLSKFSLLAGALGVGVGFGLQNVVNNFVSGLILLFERPIQTDDVVEVGALLGTVRRIGIRSSTLRTLDGAEVIVPNANLISDQVVNWTLSDRQRRIEINVGVKYGTDPECVIELLLEVARDDGRILEHPEPDALFLEFGDSSLNFTMRCWTARYGEWVQIRSDLNVAVNRALADAGIEIPFPQRDLHVRSVSEGAGAMLRRSDED